MSRRSGVAQRVVVKTIGPSIGGSADPLPDAEYDGDGDFRVNDGQPNERPAPPEEQRPFPNVVETLRRILGSDPTRADREMRAWSRSIYETNGTDHSGRPWKSQVLRVSETGTGRYRVTGAILDGRSDSEIGEFTRELDFFRRRVDHFDIALDQDRMGQGIGGSFVRQTLERVRDAGFQQADLVAFSGGKVNGVFVWPRLGFEVAGPLQGDDNLEAFKRLGKTLKGEAPRGRRDQDILPGLEITGAELIKHADRLKNDEGGYLDLNIEMTLDLSRLPDVQMSKSANIPTSWRQWQAIADTWVESQRNPSAKRVHNNKSLGSTIGRIRAVIGSRESFDPDAVNGDPTRDNTVQDGTPWERPATPLRRAITAVRQGTRRIADSVRDKRTKRRSAAMYDVMSLDDGMSASGLRRLLNRLGPSLRESEITPEDLVNHVAMIRSSVEGKHGDIRTGAQAKAVLRKVLPNLIDSPSSMPTFTNADGELTARERGWVHTIVYHAERHPEAAKWLMRLDYSPTNTRWGATPEARGYVASAMSSADNAPGFGLVLGINGRDTDIPEPNHHVGHTALLEMIEQGAADDVIAEARATLTAQHEWGHVLHNDRILRHAFPDISPDDSPLDRAQKLWNNTSDNERAAAYAAKNLQYDLATLNDELRRAKKETIPAQVIEALVNAKYRDLALDPDSDRWEQAVKFLDAWIEKLESQGIDVRQQLTDADILKQSLSQIMMMTRGNKPSLVRHMRIGSATDSPDEAEMKLYRQLLGPIIGYTYGLYSMDDLSKDDGLSARKDLHKLSLYAASDPFGREAVAEAFSAREMGVNPTNTHAQYIFDEWMKVPKVNTKSNQAMSSELPFDFGFPAIVDTENETLIFSCSPGPSSVAMRRARRSTTSKDSTVLQSPSKKGLGPKIGDASGPPGDAEYDGDHDGWKNDGKPNQSPAPPKEVQKAVENATKIVEGDGVEQLMVDPVPEFAKVLPRAQEVDYHAIRAREPAFRRELADILRDAPDGIDTQPGVREAFDAFIKEVDAQYERLQKILEDMGVKLEFIMDDPYADVAEMEHDLRVNKRFKVLMTKATGSHSLMSDEQNDRLRAVHDAFGHLGTGRGFDRHGEEAAYQAHRTMFSPLAQRVLAAEFRAQTAYLIEYKAFLEEQKATIMPARYVKMSRLWVQVKAISARSIGQRVTKNPVRITADDDNLYKVGKSHHVSGGRHFRPGSTKA